MSTFNTVCSIELLLAKGYNPVMEEKAREKVILHMDRDALLAGRLLAKGSSIHLYKE